MATYSVPTPTKMSALTAKAGGDTFNVAGATARLTQDTDSRFGLNQNTSAIAGAINLSASAKGDFDIEARYVRLIPYDTGSGNVPAAGTTISQGGASGVLIGVYDTLAVAPTTAGSAMPADGYIKVTEWNGTYYSAGALTGLGANATGQDIVGWIEVVGQESVGVTMSRLNNNGVSLVKGAWYKVGTTGGSRSDTYQIPSNGVDQYHAGVLIGKAAPVSISSMSWAAGILTVNTTGAHGFSDNDEVIIDGALPYAYTSETSELEPITVIDSDTFTMPREDDPGTYVSGGTAVAVEWYKVTPTSALLASIGTEAVRGKYCWISTAGVLRLGNDGTNSTGGYLPASGLPIYVPNVFLNNATSGAKTVNSLPASPNTRYSVTTTAAGELTIDRAVINWRMNAISTPSILEIRNSTIYTTLQVTTNGSKAILDTVCISSSIAHTNGALVFTNSTQGATVSDSVIGAPTWGAANQNIFNPSSSRDFTFDRCDLFATGNKNVTSNYVVNGTTADNIVFTDCKFSIGFFLFNQSSAIRIINPTYIGASGGKTEVANSSNLFNIISKTSDVVVDGLNFGGLTGVTQRGYLASVTTGSTDFTLKNIADIATPLDVGDAGLTDVVTSRSGAVCTIPHTAHGYVNGETIVVDKSDTIAIQPGTKVITYIDANSYSIPCTNTGTATPKISFYYSAMTGVLSGAAGVVDVTVQNVNVIHNSQAPYVTVTSNKDFTFENVYTEPRNPTQPTRAGTNITERSCSFGTTVPAAISAVYGTIFLDNFLRPTTTPNPTGLAWTRSGSTISLPSPAHGLSNGDIVQVYDSTVPTGAINGLVAMTVIDGDNLTYVGLPVGTASGTLSYRVNDSRLSILMNEKNTDTDTYYTVVSNSAGLTGSGTLSAPTIGDKRYWQTPNYIKGYNSAPNILPYFLNLTQAQSLAFNLTYDLDRGSGFSGTMKSLHAVRTGASGTSGTPQITGLNSTTGLLAGDYAFGTGVADGAKILTVDSASQVTLDINHVATVSGSITFNQLPSEATFPADGVKFKVELETIATNTTPIIAINIPLTSTGTTRARLYPQAVDSYSLIIDGNTGDTVKLFLSSDDSILQEEVLAGDPFEYQYVHDGTDIAAYYIVVSDDYKVIKEDISLIAADQSLVLGFEDDLVWDATADETRYDVQFANELIVMESGETVYDIRGAYTTWKNLLRVSDNGKYDLAYTVDGGKEYDAPKSIPYLTGLINGWRIRPDEANHQLTVENGILYVDGGGNPFVNTVGAYNVQIPFAAPIDVLTVSTGSAVTPTDKTDIIEGVWDELLSAHTTAGTTGKKLTDLVNPTVPTSGDIATAVESQLADEFNAIPTAAENATAVAGELGDEFTDIETKVDSVQTDVDTNQRLIKGLYGK